eukprot:SAG31_NODE_18939_length_617_cov_0.969112_1_plen_54_part_00
MTPPPLLLLLLAALACRSVAPPVGEAMGGADAFEAQLLPWMQQVSAAAPCLEL